MSTNNHGMIDTSMTGALGRFLDVDTARYKLVATNLANIDTPNYSHVVWRPEHDSQGCWRHRPRRLLGALPGCALVCRHFARKISYPDPGKAYLAGLLHDLGIIVNLWTLRKEFRTAFELARTEGIPLHEAEQSVLGFTHCDSGRLLANRWELSPDLCEVVSLHHKAHESRNHAALVALVEISDLLCRMSALNHGFTENREVNLLQQTGFAVLSQQFPELREFDWARLTFELDSYMDEVHSLVRAIYRK